MIKHRFTGTDAALMLAEGLRIAAQERQLSLREIGRRLSYKQPVVLSHMASGRVPIPIDRATEIADHVGIAPNIFLTAVLRQQHPNVDWAMISEQSDPFVAILQKVAGKPLHSLSEGHHQVLLEAVKDSRPQERWLAMPEIAAVNFIRELFPRLTAEGLSIEDCQKLRECFQKKEDANEQ